MASYSNVPDLEDTSDRQAALRRYHILDTEPEKDFDRITSLVAKVCEVPTALITLIDEERQWFKSCFGFDARETDLGVSFCVHAVHQGEMLVVEDATADPRFKDNPIVTGPPHIRFYAGAPLTTPEGVHIGTLCIIDYEPRIFDAAQREILERLADVVVNQFELRSAEAQVRQLVDQNPQPMYVYAQSDDSILHANVAARKLYGYEEAALSSLTGADLEAPPKAQPSSDDLSMHKRRDGSFFPVRLREREVLFEGRAATLAVPQSVSKQYDTDPAASPNAETTGTKEFPGAPETAASEDSAPNEPTSSVFSTDLPSFAENEPSSSSVPTGGPEDVDPNTPSESTSSNTVDATSPSAADRERNPEPFDLVEKLHDLLDEHGPALQDQNVGLDRSLPSTSLPVRLDPRAIREIVNALLGAAAPTPGSTVTVRAGIEDKDVRLSVNVATSVDDEEAPDLPLPLIDQMSGNLDVESDGVGTQFVLTLPRSSAPSSNGGASLLSSECSAG